MGRVRGTERWSMYFIVTGPLVIPVITPLRSLAFNIEYSAPNLASLAECLSFSHLPDICFGHLLLGF